MPTYVVLVNYTEQGIRNVRETITRTDHGGEIAQKHGLKLEQAYWTVGPYDMVAIFEAPDDEAISAHLLEIGSLGNVRTTRLGRTTRKRCQASSRDSVLPPGRELSKEGPEKPCEKGACPKQQPPAPVTLVTYLGLPLNPHSPGTIGYIELHPSPEELARRYEP